MGINFIRSKAAQARLNNSRSNHYRQISDGLMPPPISLGPLLRVYPQHEIDTLAAAITRGLSQDERRELVKLLMEARRAADSVIPNVGALIEAAQDAALRAADAEGVQSGRPVERVRSATHATAPR